MGRADLYKRSQNPTYSSTHLQLTFPTLEGIKVPTLSLSLLKTIDETQRRPVNLYPGVMDLRVGILLLCVLGASWSCNARQLVGSDMSDLKMNGQEQEMIIQSLERNPNVCTLCEQYASQALTYLAENKTQTEIIDTLHTSCSQLRTFKQECVTLVDYYAPLFFLEVSSIQPEDFCQRVNLCEQITITSSQLYQDSCGFCHQAVEEILLKLKDPDTQLEILEILLKVCDAADNYSKKCKRMVFEYGPLIITNGEKFLETTDICSTLHACNTPTAINKQELPLIVLSDS